MVLLDAISRPSDVAVVAERILSACDAPYQIGEHQVRSSASIGIVCCDQRYRTSEEMLRDADIAMYEAKARGKARYVIFDSSMQQAVHERVQIETDMRAAVGTDQFFLRYQPIIGLEDRELHGAEALVRWKHPTRGEISRAISSPSPKKRVSFCRSLPGSWSRPVVSSQNGRLRPPIDAPAISA